MKDISFNCDISGTTDVLVVVENIFCKRVLKKINFKAKAGAHETHEVCWQEDLVEVTKSSNVSVPEMIQLAKLQSYANNDIFVNVVSIIKSFKPSL